MRFLNVRLQVANKVAEATLGFYVKELGLPAYGSGFRVGHAVLEFTQVEGEEPFYHFALRVPRNRFAAARDWIAKQTRVLGYARFDNWDADACYFEDPAGNIVELIAHQQLPEETSDESFAATELLGVCELGVVGADTRSMAKALEPLGIRLSDGSLEPGSLAFMGGRDGVLILCPEGRGWMPTGRPAEPHALKATVAGSRAAEVVLPGTQNRIRTLPTG